MQTFEAGASQPNFGRLFSLLPREVRIAQRSLAGDGGLVLLACEGRPFEAEALQILAQPVCVI
jgi:hypothetical protein